jgi:hypothetical protein
MKKAPTEAGALVIIPFTILADVFPIGLLLILFWKRFLFDQTSCYITIFNTIIRCYHLAYKRTKYRIRCLAINHIFYYLQHFYRISVKLIFTIFCFYYFVIPARAGVILFLLLHMDGLFFQIRQ